MKVFVKLVFIIWILISNLSFSQYKKRYFINPNAENLNQYQFDFSAFDKQYTLDEKVELYVEEVVLKDTNAIGFYTDLNTYAEFQELRKDKKAFYKKIDAEHHAKNLHILDLNKDGLDDFVFNYFSLEAETTNIKLFLNKGTYYSSQSIPGDFIVNFSNWKVVYFETFGWACCSDPYRHYYISTFKNDSLIVDKHVQIPVNLFIPDKILKDGIDLKRECSIVFEKEKNVFETPEGSNPMTYFGQKIIVKKDHILDYFFDFKENEISKYFVEVPIIDKKNPEIELSIFAWLFL